MQNLDPTQLHVEMHAERFWQEPESFQDVMAQQLRHAPWLGLSIALHALILLILLAIPAERTVKKTAAVITAEPAAETPPVEVPPPEEKKPVEPDESLEPEMQETEVITEPEPVDTSTDTELQPDDSAFEKEAFNPAIGIGGGAGGKTSGRNPGGRRSKQGRPEAKAVTIGLRWLQNHQEADGHWSAAEFMRHCPAGDGCGGPGNAVNDVGLTGLALLAFLGDGSTMRSGKYREVVKKATIWLVDQQDESGLIGTEAGRQFMYNHALAALALVESYGLSQYRTLRRHAQRAVDYVCKARNPYKVWRYYPHDGDNDSSVTGWMVFVLESARDFKLTIDEDALKYSKAWFDEVTDPSTGQCGYTKRGEGSSREIGMEQKFPAARTEAMTAVGLLCRIFMGQTPENTPVLRTAADTLLKKLPAWNEADGSIDLYYWYYGTYAMFQMGKQWWDKWRVAMEKALIRTQHSKGCREGSWDPIDPWSGDGGRVYSTAIGVLCLQVYYRYTPLLR